MKELQVPIPPMGIVKFYDAVALELGYKNTDNLNYDCTKILVSSKIQEVILNYYKDVECQDADYTGMIWVAYGPKAIAEWDGYKVQVEDGFIKEANNEQRAN